MLLTNGTRQVIPMQRLHVLNFERIEVEVVEAEEGRALLDNAALLGEHTCQR